jgi:hypothetical protein
MSLPEPFGWRTSWIAARTTDTQSVAPELQLVNLKSCEWEEGLEEANDKGIFICPAVSGWTLIVGLRLPDASSENTLPLIVRLSEVHQEAQYFGNHRVVDYYAWAKAERGRLVRAYAFVGDQGATPWDGRTRAGAKLRRSCGSPFCLSPRDGARDHEADQGQSP